MKRFLLALLLVASMIMFCEGAWDNTTNMQGIAPATAVQQIQNNFTASGGTAGGILMPSGAAFYMFSGSCPTGTTDVTSTYSNKFIKVNATQLTTGGEATHTLTTAEMPSHTHNTYTTASGAATYPVTTTGTSDVSSGYTTSSTGGGVAFPMVPSFVTAKLCIVD